jgi:hypothetical protein
MSLAAHLAVGCFFCSTSINLVKALFKIGFTCCQRLPLVRLEVSVERPNCPRTCTMSSLCCSFNGSILCTSRSACTQISLCAAAVGWIGLGWAVAWRWIAKNFGLCHAGAPEGHPPKRSPHHTLHRPTAPRAVFIASSQGQLIAPTRASHRHN